MVQNKAQNLDTQITDNKIRKLLGNSTGKVILVNAPQAYHIDF